MIISVVSSVATAQAYEYTPPEKVTNFYVTQISKTSIKLGWYEAWSGIKANGFEVSSYNTATKEYSPVKLVNAVHEYKEYKYNVAGLKQATKYAFAIRPYIVINDEYYYGEYSDLVYACTSPNEPTLSSTKYISTGKIEVKWKAVSGVSGYAIEYCSNSKFENDGTTCYLNVNSSTTSKTISSLAKKKYYVRVRSYISYNGLYYCSDYSKAKSVEVKSGASLKSMINSIGTATESRNLIKSYTNNGVDINKYNSTYDRFKAIYDWHSKHNTDYGWNCVGCNSNFNVCIAALFKNKKKNDPFIFLGCNNFKNSNGSVVMHKWSIIYFAGVAHIFDPRLQGYTSNKTGTTYFGISPTSATGKKYLFDGYFSFFPTTFDTDAKNESYYPYYSYPYVDSVARPADIKLTATAKQGATKLNWNESKGANGYEIQYSTMSDMSSSQTVTITSKKTLSKTISDLGSNKTYYIRARAYKTVDGTKIYSYWTGKQTVKTRHINEANPTSISKLTAKSKGFTINWKTVNNASGYQISYSTSSSFKKPTTKTYSGASTKTKTISKLKAKQKYYVRIRTYKTVNDKKYYSAWSSSKTIKTK